MKKILITGDIAGNFDSLIEKINQFSSKGQQFDFVLSVGQTFSKTQNFSEYYTQTKQIPIPLYFIDTSELSPVLNSLYPNGHKIIPNLNFLGRSGIIDIDGLKIAYLSGIKNDTASFIFNRPPHNQEPHAYNGGYYTERELSKIKQDQIEQKCDKVIDILLTSEWPQGFNSNLEGNQVFNTPISNLSSDVTRLALLLKPRYHFVGLENLFYQRVPYLNNENEHITRLIALGKLPQPKQTTKERYMFAIQIEPFSKLSKEDLLVRTSDTTLNPYIQVKAQGQNEKTLETILNKPSEVDQMLGAKKETEELKENMPLYFFGFDRLNRDTDIYEFLSRWGTIKDFQLMYDERKKSKGSGFVLFDDLKITNIALKDSQKYSFQGRKIGFNKSNRGANQGKLMQKTNHECWFCLQSPNVNKTLIVYIGNDIYLAIDKGPITRRHLQIIPIDHYPNSISLPLQVSDEIQAVKVKLADLYEKEFDCGLIFFERYIKVTQNIAHMFVNVVPFELKKYDEIIGSLEDSMKNNKFGFFRLGINDKLKDLVDESEYFLLIEVANKGIIRNQISELYNKRYLYAMGEADSKNFPKDYGRELICGIFNMKNRLDWRNCVLTDDEISKTGSEMRIKLGKYLS